jgi:hypothetical protein
MPRSNATMPRDFIVSTVKRNGCIDDSFPAKPPEHLGKHLLIVGAYESVQQNPGWQWDPLIFMIGDFDGKAFKPDDAYAPPQRYCSHHL